MRTLHDSGSTDSLIVGILPSLSCTATGKGSPELGVGLVPVWVHLSCRFKGCKYVERTSTVVDGEAKTDQRDLLRSLRRQTMGSRGSLVASL